MYQESLLLQTTWPAKPETASHGAPNCPDTRRSRHANTKLTRLNDIMKTMKGRKKERGGRKERGEGKQKEGENYSAGLPRGV